MARNTKTNTDDKAAVQTVPETPKETQEGTQGTQGTQETQEGTQGTQETQEGQEAPQADPVIVFVDHEGGLNLRDGPHQSFHALAVLENKTPLEVIPLRAGLEIPGWAAVRCEVDSEALVCWVCTDFVRED